MNKLNFIFFITTFILISSILIKLILQIDFYYLFDKISKINSKNDKNKNINEFLLGSIYITITGTISTGLYFLYYKIQDLFYRYFYF
jgi:hypothetical protein